MIHVIAIALAAPERNQRAIDDWVAATFADSAQVLPQVWIASGAAGADQIRSGLQPMLSAGDRLVVVKSATEAVWHGVPQPVERWLAENFPGSITERVAGKTEGVFEE